MCKEARGISPVNYKKQFAYFTEQEHGTALYQLLNDIFYDSQLPDIEIKYGTMKTAEDPHSIQVNGEFCLADPETGKPSIMLDPSVIHIGLVGDTWNRRFYRLCGDMLHEMAHYYCSLNNIRETEQRGMYHNTAFRKVAADHGLSVGLNFKHPELDGYNSTTCTAAAEQLIAKRLKGMKF